ASEVKQGEKGGVRLGDSTGLRFALDMEKEGCNIEDVAFGVRARDDWPDDGHRATVEFAFRMIEKKRRNEPVRARIPLRVAVVPVEEEGHDPKVDVAARAIAEIGAHEGEGPAPSPV